MIAHIVMWNVRGATPQCKKEAALFVKNCFETLIGRIPGLKKLQVGIDISCVDYACDVVLYTEFDTMQSLTAYASHPDHLRVKQELGDSRTERYQVDYALEEELAPIFGARLAPVQ